MAHLLRQATFALGQSRAPLPQLDQEHYLMLQRKQVAEKVQRQQVASEAAGVYRKSEEEETLFWVDQEAKFRALMLRVEASKRGAESVDRVLQQRRAAAAATARTLAAEQMGFADDGCETTFTPSCLFAYFATLESY